MNKELNILIQACRLYIGTADLSDWQKAIDDDTLDWQKLLKLASWHQIRPILYDGLLTYRPATFPDNVFETLKIYCQHLAIGNLSRFQQAQELTTMLAQNRVVALLHKGVHYASFYKSLAHREFGDIDVLVNENEVEKAATIALANDYVFFQDYESLKNITKTDYHLILKPKKSHFSFIEIHWRPVIQSWFRVNDIVDNAESLVLNNFGFKIPSNDDTLALLVAHHGYKENWQKLKDMLDLELFGYKKNDIETQKKLSESLTIGLNLCQFLFYGNNAFENQQWLDNAERMKPLFSEKANAEKNQEGFLGKIGRWFYKFKSFSWTTQITVIKVCFWLLIIKILINTLPFPKLKKVFSWLISDSLPRSVSSQTSSPLWPVETQATDKKLSQTAWAIRVVAARWPWRATCLPQAMTYKYLLRHDPTLELHIGVNHDTNGNFQAHAWVEKAGKILIGETSENFSPLWVWK